MTTFEDEEKLNGRREGEREKQRHRTMKRQFLARNCIIFETRTNCTR